MHNCNNRTTVINGPVVFAADVTNYSFKSPGDIGIIEKYYYPSVNDIHKFRSQLSDLCVWTMRVRLISKLEHGQFRVKYQKLQ